MKILLRFNFALYKILLLLSILGLSYSVFAQNNDSLLPFDNEADSKMSRTEYRKLLKRIQASDDFYYRIKRKADSGYIYKQLYPLIFRKPQTAENLKIDNLPANATFRRYRNRVIRSVRIIKLNPFGTSIYDTIHLENRGITKTINDLHFPTRDDVIKSYLLFKEGDRLNPVKISDNERIIRNAPIFEDARFIVDPVSRDTVDLILVVKDIFPVGADLKINSVKNFSLRLYNRNIFGLGHQFGQSFGYNKHYSPSFFLGEGSYTIRNIRHSFTDFSVLWSNDPLQKRIGIDLTRPFVTPETHFAGGLYIAYNRSWLYNNTSSPRYIFTNRIFDVWAGYATITNRLKDISSRRQQIALTARLYQLDFYDTPPFSLLSEPPMVNTTRILFAFHVLRSEFYRTNMLYGYGRTEDIPYGHHAEVVFGWENTELTNRFYTALKADFLKPITYAGLIGLDLQIGGYLKNGFYEDGVLKTSLKLISPLVKSGKNSIRNFAFLGFTTGLSRSVPGKLSINDGNTGNLFNNYELLGYKRMRVHIESVLFTQNYFLGFRFAPFVYADAAVVAPKDQRLAIQNIYPAIGLGIRFRNENLVFSTFQISFAVHLIAPENIRAVEFFFSDLPQTGLEKYLIEKPEIVEYK